MPALKTSLTKSIQLDPREFANALEGLAIRSDPLTFASATQTLGSVPANSVIKNVHIIRTTAWDAITTFEVGKTGDTDWLVTTAQAAVTDAIGAGEDGEVVTVAVDKVVTSETDIILTLDQGAAAAGAGYVVVEYSEFVV